MRKARIPDCHPSEKHAARGMCKVCYAKWQHQIRKGDPEYRARRKEAKRRDYLKNIQGYKDRASAHYIANHQKKLEYQRDYVLKSKYGITRADYDRMLAEQNGVCAICRGPQQLWRDQERFFCMDHDHTTGKNRQLLCNNCNAILGLAQDSQRILNNAIEYLRRHTIIKVAAA